MKHAAFFLAALLMISLVAAPADAGRKKTTTYTYDHDDDDRYQDKLSVDMKRGNLVLTHNEYDRPEVEITADYELYVDDERVKLDEDQQKMVTLYYDLAIKLRRQAKEIGWEGARIGAGGVKLGVKALGRVVKMLFTDYDEDDLERDMERDAEKLEDKAEILEKKAEEIERMAEDFEDLTYEMFDDIPELNDLEWL